MVPVEVEGEVFKGDSYSSDKGYPLSIVHLEAIGQEGRPGGPFPRVLKNRGRNIECNVHPVVKGEEHRVQCSSLWPDLVFN